MLSVHTGWFSGDCLLRPKQNRKKVAASSSTVLPLPPLILPFSNHRTRWTNDQERVLWTLNGKLGLLAMSLLRSTSLACNMTTRESVRDPCLQLHPDQSVNDKF